MKTTLFAILLLAFMAAPAAFAQGTQPAPRAAAADDAGVTEKGFRSRIFEVRHRDPSKLLRILQTLGSGFKGSAVTVNQEFKTITVRDFPENIAVMEDALKRLDTPEARRAEVELRVHLLVASNTAGATNEVPAELNEVIRQLQSTLRYRNYQLMTSSTHRAHVGTEEVENKGAAEPRVFGRTTPQQNPIFYNYRIHSITVDDAAPTAAGATPGPVVQLGNFKFDLRLPINVGTEIRWEPLGFSTPVSIRPGETVVVGATTLEERGVVVVLSARVLR